MSRKALGRGLEALIPTRPLETAKERSENTRRPPAAVVAKNVVPEVPLDRIEPNPYQPRRRFDAEQIKELAESIRKNGVLQPVLVREQGDGYQLIAGERRLRAARIAGLDAIPVHIREIDDRELLRLAILENVQRQDLNPIEEAQGYQRLIDEFQMSQQEIADRLGKSRSAIANTLRLLQLPEDLQGRITDGELTAGHAKALLSAEDLESQTRLANLVRQQKLTVRELEQITQREGRASRRTRRARPQNPALAELEKRLEARFGTRVRIRARKDDGSLGKLEIDYYSASDLERIFEIAGVPYLL